MLKTANLTVRVKPDTRNRIETLVRITRRSKSYVIEEALEQYDWSTGFLVPFPF